MAETQILIVEDESIVALDIESRLQKMGYRVCGKANSGEVAMKFAREKNPHLVLMDVNLRGKLDGIDVAEYICNELDIPVIYVTSHLDEDTLQRAKRTGPYGYVVKPFREMELHTAIEIAIYKHHTDKKLRDYASALETSNRELEAFAHTVAHDLKSVLSSIITGADVLELYCDKMPLEDLKRRLRTLSQTGRKMNNIIEELLALSEIKNPDVERKPLDMARIVAGALERLAYLIEEYHAEIIQPETWPNALGHGPWIEEVWVNYLSNSIKYGGNPPRVELGSTLLSDDRVCFWIHDNGPGIPVADQQKIFQPFTRLDREQARGYGLGLSIVQRIIEKLDGKVGMESQEGEGSVFYFVLPAATE